MIKKIGKLLLERFKLYHLYSLRKTGPLYEDGWFRSYEEQKCIDLSGNPIPWMTYPAIDFLKQRINSEMNVFEYGSGGSTLWWASRVNRVVSVEHDINWFQEIYKCVPANVSLVHVDLVYGGAYSKKVAEFKNEFDIILIDGRDRVNCTFNAVGALKPDGVIIFDNSDRENYRRAYEFLYNQRFRSINFVGMCPIVNFKSETSIFYRDNNCLKI